MLEERLREEHHFYGLDLATLGTDFEPRTIVTVGHVQPLRFIAACNALVRREWGWKNLADGEIEWNLTGYPETFLGALEGMRYAYAHYLTCPADSEDDDGAYDWSEFDWYLVAAAPDEPEAVQITVWSEYPRLWESV